MNDARLKRGWIMLPGEPRPVLENWVRCPECGSEWLGDPRKPQTCARHRAHEVICVPIIAGETEKGGNGMSEPLSDDDRSILEDAANIIERDMRGPDSKEWNRREEAVRVCREIARWNYTDETTKP